ncbi:aldo/keto reductase [Kushneria aurantia]|uniref:Aldo/keto reductase n=1 Tax=Kushneria aurantia TaxID=504092 RepID=A0ABV6FYH2_9GAMM|nr:aldo/keto reductase [Kushneria aurantia]
MTRYVRLAGSDVPAIGQGTWHMGEGQYPRQDEVNALRRGLDAGMTLIDTAEMYASGEAEKVVGEAISGRRDDAFLVSKLLPSNAGRHEAVAACEASLKRLGVEQLDLYLLHWRGGTRLSETLEAFEQLEREGKIAAFGVSNFDVDDIEELYTLKAGERCAANQVLYHLGSREIELGLQPLQRRNDLPTMAYCPLAQGGRDFKRLANNRTVRAIANEYDITPSQLLLAWSVRDDDVIALPKAVSPGHVDENAAALEIQLDEDALERLDDAFPLPEGSSSIRIV